MKRAGDGGGNRVKRHIATAWIQIRARPGARALAAIALLAVCASGFGCSSPPPASPGWPKGLELEMLVTAGDDVASLYLVRPDGTISWGGGYDARHGRTSWTGPLTGEEIDQLHRLLDELEWFTRAPASAADDDGAPRGEPAYRIKLRWRNGKRDYTVRGPSPDVAPIEELLQRAARRRLDVFLQTLPKAGER